MRSALIVEDRAAIRAFLRLHLDAAGFQVEECADGVEALRVSGQRTFDLIVLDAVLPGRDGASVCRGIRGGGPNAESPIVIITARSDEPDAGEFLARVAAATRWRARCAVRERSPGLHLSKGPVTIDVDKRRVVVRGRPIELTRQEFNLLHRLAARRGIVFSRAALLQHVWSGTAHVTERTVDSVISRLRRKIERNPRDPELILTAWGIGYKFADVN